MSTWEQLKALAGLPSVFAPLQNHIQVARAMSNIYVNLVRTPKSAT